MKTRLYTEDRETGTFIDLVFTIEEGEKYIKDYEADDKQEGTYSKDFYDIVNENHESVLY